MNVESMLAAFNSNMQENAQMLEYINRPNVFDTIGKARNEMAHSKMIAHLLSAYHIAGRQESSIVHLLDIIVKRSAQQSISIPSELKNAVLTRDLSELQLEKCETEVPLSKLKASYKGMERIDIHLLYKLKNTLVKSGRGEIEIFIENKVQSQEHDGQTETYYQALKAGKGNGKYQLFLYLTPVSTRVLDDFSNMKEKPECKNFVCVNYQDILESIIEPLLAENTLSDRERFILKDYVSCLELPALPDTNKDGVQDKFDMSIMATSAHERDLINKFLSVENNRQLIQLATSSVCGVPSYTYKEKMGLTFNEALPMALNDYVEGKTELDVLAATCSIFTRKKGATPFMVWSPNGRQYVPCDLYETGGAVYPNLYTAAAHSIMSYAKNHGKEPSEVVAEFGSVYGKQKKGKPLLSNVPGEEYEPFDVDFYIRTDVGEDRINSIFVITAIPIRPVNGEEFHNLLMSDNRNLEDFLQDLIPDLYSRIVGTNFYYRHNTEDRIDEINKCLNEKIDKVVISPTDKALLKKFYDSHLGLILSVHKIMIEGENDTVCYEAHQDILKKLLKQHRQ